MRIPGIRVGVLLNGSLYFAFGAFDTLWARFLTDRGANTTLVGVSLALAALPIVGLTPRGGRFADSKGHVRVGVVGLVLTGLIVGAYGVIEGLVTVIVLSVVQTVVESAVGPAVVAIGANAAPIALTAGGQGTLGAAGAGGAALASLIAGPLYGSIGPAGAWMAVGAVQMAGAVLAGLVALQSRRVSSG
jgi:MFS family permease